jgi:hypothetical protein
LSFASFTYSTATTATTAADAADADANAGDKKNDTANDGNNDNTDANADDDDLDDNNINSDSFLSVTADGLSVQANIVLAQAAANNNSSESLQQGVEGAVEVVQVGVFTHILFSLSWHYFF